MADGTTFAACAKATLEAVTIIIATMLENGERPPGPARDGVRDQQVNIRISARERQTLENLAIRDGFRTVSDYVRAAALNRAG